MTDGYIYLIITREFLQSQQEVVKAGFTTDIKKRHCQYPKGSKLLYCEYVQSAKDREKDVLYALGNKFKQRSDIGREYFEGPFKEIRKTVVDELELHAFALFTNIVKPSQTLSVPTVSKSKSNKEIKDELIGMFYSEYGVKLSERVMKSADVFGVYQEWKTKNDTNNADVSQQELTKGLRRMFSVNCHQYRFADGMHQALYIGDGTEIICRSFANEYVECHEGSFITMQMIKEVFLTAPGYVDIPSKLKEYLEKILGVTCHEYKLVNGKKLKSVFEGYRLKSLPIIEEVKKPAEIDIFESWFAENVRYNKGSICSTMTLLSRFTSTGYDKHVVFLKFIKSKGKVKRAKVSGQQVMCLLDHELKESVEKEENDNLGL